MEEISNQSKNKYKEEYKNRNGEKRKSWPWVGDQRKRAWGLRPWVLDLEIEGRVLRFSHGGSTWDWLLRERKRQSCLRWWFAATACGGIKWGRDISREKNWPKRMKLREISREKLWFVSMSLAEAWLRAEALRREGVMRHWLRRELKWEWEAVGLGIKLGSSDLGFTNYNDIYIYIYIRGSFSNLI